ncbi:MAG: methyltransferase domain-containing protein [Pyrinomonadaceae bacterium]|nr:methyltransferase domain-containing protein [Pyrinomonadaceae bacterium]
MSRANQARGGEVANHIDQAIAAMLDEYRGNDWMLNEHWPLNEPHVRLMIADVMARFPPGPNVRLLDVGCFNGYISFLFKHLGYHVTGTDVCELEDRRAIFEKAGIEFESSNLNDAEPFKHLAAEQFDIVIIAQVIEHILSHPLGLIRSLADTMRTGGLMILTTPNPATLMNAIRVLRGRSLLWGTNDFIDHPKFERGEIISQGEIHYREYTSAELRHMLEGAGLRVELSRYLGLGDSSTQSPLKKLVKNNPLSKTLTSYRLLASNHYFLARKV